MNKYSRIPKGMKIMSNLELIGNSGCSFIDKKPMIGNLEIIDSLENMEQYSNYILMVDDKSVQLQGIENSYMKIVLNRDHGIDYAVDLLNKKDLSISYLIDLGFVQII